MNEVQQSEGQKTMRVVKTVGVIVLVEDKGEFFLIREKVERSQAFETDKEVWTALRTRKIHWNKC